MILLELVPSSFIFASIVKSFLRSREVELPKFTLSFTPSNCSELLPTKSQLYEVAPEPDKVILSEVQTV